MRKEIKYFIYCFLLGAGLVIYATSTYATKEEVKTLNDTINKIDRRVYDLHTHFGLKDKNK